MVDPGRARSLLERIRGETDQLRRLAALPPDDLLSDGNLMAAVKYRFIVAIEACIDIGEHIASSEKMRSPNDFADTFAVLGENDVVPEDSVPTLQEMARFRNLLVHGYQQVDDARVVEILHKRLDDLDRFRADVARALTD